MDNLLPTHIKDVWLTKQFKEMTPVQLGTFQNIVEGKDIIAISPTGTGKTLAYALPLIRNIEKNNELQALILVPSQELAQQVATVFREWSNLVVQVISGGANLKRQLEKLKNRPEIIVATPGRLKELSEQSKKIKYHQLKTIVLDEADYLLKKEHINAVRDIVKRAPSQRQLLFFSATLTEPIENISTFFNTEATVTVYKADQQSVLHEYLVIEERKKVEIMRKLAAMPDINGLVFTKNIAQAALLFEKLDFHHIPVAVLHSDMHHIQREKVMTKLRQGALKFLITTDVASRGLDIDHLKTVIHYDLPRERETYLHRSGRVGRMGKFGEVIALVSLNDIKEYKKLLPKSISADHIDIQNGKIKKV